MTYKVGFLKTTEISFSIIIHLLATNKLISHVKKAKFVCSLLMYVVWSGCQISLVSRRLLLIFVYSGKRAFGRSTCCRVDQKKLADRNVCSVLIASTRSDIGYFYFSLRTRSPSQPLPLRGA